MRVAPVPAAAIMAASHIGGVMNANPYLALGVRPFINCCSVRTMHGGSLMLPQVRRAMAEAARHFVNLDELMEAAGRRIAELTGAEWGIVTCGSAAAVALATAACVAGNDPVKMLRLPFTDGMVNRVVIPKNQRFAYDQAVRMVGTHMVEIDGRADLERALAEPVAMVVLLGKEEARGAIRLEEIAAIVKPRHVPILVDAASEHIAAPSPWLVRGADLVVYSGGKFLRGPQTSGLLLGNKPLVEAAWRNASPHQAFGRPMKVSKEDVIGVLAALEYWFGERDEAAERRRWYEDLAVLAKRVEPLPGVTAEIRDPSGVDRVPHLVLSWERARYPIDGLLLRQKLLDGEPRIMLDDNSASPNAIAIDPFNLEPGEAALVGDAVAAVLRRLDRAEPAAAPPPVRDLAGTWRIEVEFLHGRRLHDLTLRQDGTLLSGHQHSAQFEGPVEGEIRADEVRFSFDGHYEGARISFRFSGKADDGAMRGEVALGAASFWNQGILNLTQFGPGTWRAHRVA
jgi:D-glucosaminate-6-phosphate ammonia-lyase